ncbi:MAG: transposase DNA-binding-containing protein [bacterium]|nr:transposase DNA-binding-containing protein [bacterium]
MTYSLGAGTTEEFITQEFSELILKDTRLEKRARRILSILQNKLGSCVRRLFLKQSEARQAYDFF